jgi:hypothetical protein
MTSGSLREDVARVHVACEHAEDGAALFERLGRLEIPLRPSVVPIDVLELEPAPDLFLASARCSKAIARRLSVAALRFPYPEVLLVGEEAVSAVRGRRSAYQVGALRYVALNEFEAALEEVVRCLVPLKRVIVSLVGRMPLKDVQRAVRGVMVLDALSRGNGSRRFAARTLGVTRPAVQQMLADFSVLKERQS